MQTTIRNDEPQSSTKRLKVLVVTPGQADVQEQIKLLNPGESITVEVGSSRFAMLDEKEGS